jgi:hypothetical protein
MGLLNKADDAALNVLSNSSPTKKLTLNQTPVITVTGKAFYDIGHAPADHSNRRSTPKGYAVWEIHPVMKMEVMQ